MFSGVCQAQTPHIGKNEKRKIGLPENGRTDSMRDKALEEHFCGVPSHDGKRWNSSKLTVKVK
jgi:hypothetical protein